MRKENASIPWGIGPLNGKFHTTILNSECRLVAVFKNDISEADLNLIVRAVNSHDALVDALKDARFALYGNGPGNPKIDAALALAEEKP